MATKSIDKTSFRNLKFLLNPFTDNKAMIPVKIAIFPQKTVVGIASKVRPYRLKI
jgi:hypothetical protein